MGRAMPAVKRVRTLGHRQSRMLRVSCAIPPPEQRMSNCRREFTASTHLSTSTQFGPACDGMPECLCATD